MVSTGDVVPFWRMLTVQVPEDTPCDTHELGVQLAADVDQAPDVHEAVAEPAYPEVVFAAV